MIFAVLAAPNYDFVLSQAIPVKYPKNIRIGQGQWLVAGSGTAKDIAETLGFGDPPQINDGLVLSIAGYWGRKPNNVWEWIAANWA
jgi:hypothetical protein